MMKVMGPLILLVAVGCGLFLLYRSGQQLLTPTPQAQALVSGPVSPGGVTDWKLWRTLPKTTTRIRLPAYLRQPGTCFYVTAYDTHGNESAPSEVICYPGDYQAQAP